MFPTRPLFHAVRITLFMRDNCGLCIRAKSALSHVWDRRPFDYTEVNITHPEAKPWKDIYDFDVPAIHVSPSSAPIEDPKAVSKAVKLMHRFSPEEIQTKMDQVEKTSASA